VEVLRFALLGLGVGSVYAIIGLSIVLVYRASGVLNFATGAVGAVGAFLYYELTVERSWSMVPAVATTLLAGALIGVIVHRFVMSRLQTASTLARLIASLGVLIILQALIEIRWGAEPLFAGSILPSGPVRFTSELTIGQDRLWLVAICVVLTVVLWLVYSKTSFGRATSAVAENRRAAASLGWSTSRIELANWVIASVLSALSGILLAPIVGLSAATLVLLVVPALAAALVGSFSSFALTAAGALAIGVLESLTAKYLSAHVTGAATSIPFLVIIVVIVAGGRARPARSDLPTRLPGVGPGRVRPIITSVGAVVALLLILTTPVDAVAAVSASLTAAILVVSVVVVTGYAGQVSLGQWALAGMGAWIAARLVESAGLPFWLAALGGILGAVPVGIIVALPALRTRGVNLAVATLGLALVVQAMILDNGDLTGGVDGTRVGAPDLMGLSIDPIAHPRRFALFALGCFVVVAVVIANVRRGRSGRRLIAVRSNEAAAASLGIGVYGAKLYAFGLASAVAAVAGILTAFRTPIVVFSQFGILGSINAVLWAVIGGIGWVAGALAGAQFAPGSLFAFLLSKVFSPGFNRWLPVIAGVGVINTLVFAPEGVAVFYHHVAERIRSRYRNRSASRTARPPAVLPDRPTRQFDELVVEDLMVRYGGVVALQEASFRLKPGQIMGLIGPNGAGKTTFLDSVTGFTTPTAGRVSIDGVDITSWSPVRRARAGLSRSFQAVQLFDELSVRDNLLVAAEPPGIGCYFKDLVRPGRRPTSELLEVVIDEFGLREHLDSRPADLPQGLRRLVGIARAVVTEPSVLFLDEPAAGLDEHETSELGHLIRRLATERAMAIVLVEHDVPMVMATCDQVMVLDFGRQIAFGQPDQVRQDPAVISAYLGAPEDVPLPAVPVQVVVP
jgi:ABC-type branched-subunit amino acid transport system ATPase component/ABC-type branched-subunit amino acid transport system permease subunit